MKHLLVKLALTAFCALFAGTAMANTVNISYDYDNLGRLTAVSYVDGPEINYTYDRAGNITEVTHSGVGEETVSLGDALNAPDLIWTTGGDADWFGQDQAFRYGESSAQSGAISHDEKTWLETTVSGPGVISFWWKVSSENDHDFLEFYIDGSLHKAISGEQDWQKESFDLASGEHLVRWLYTKDGSVSQGADAGWVDKIEVDDGSKSVLSGENIEIDIFNDQRIIGTGAAETLNIASGINVEFTAGDGDRANLPYELENYEITSMGNHIWFSDTAANKVVTIIVTGSSLVGFANGSTALLEMVYSLQESESLAIYFLLDQDSDLIGGPLLDDINVDGIRFTVDGGDEIRLSNPDAQQTNNHDDFVAALQDELQRLKDEKLVPEDTTLTVDTARTDNTFLDDGFISSDIPAIVLKTQTEATLEPTGFSRVEDPIGDYNIYGRFSSVTTNQGNGPPQVQLGGAVVGSTPLDYGEVEF